MKLTIGNKPIALTEGTKISIERSTPFLNDDTGSFSYPFPVPRLPNQQNIGWPGRLQRDGDLPDQSFVLEDSGLQIMRGEVEYDEVTDHEIGVILQSGYTAFYKKMEGRKLASVNFGNESWPIPVSTIATTETVGAIVSKVNAWNAANTTDNGKYVLSPFDVNLAWNTIDKGHINLQFVNEDNMAAPSQMMLVRYDSWHPVAPANKGVTMTIPGLYCVARFCLQFKIWFIIKKIFEDAGYTITEEVLSTSPFFNNVVLFGNIVIIVIHTENGEFTTATPGLNALEYSTLMPDIEIISFLETFKNAFSLMYEINERSKEVKIKFKKNVFLPENLDGMPMPELAGWVHKEVGLQKGFALKYESQENELDTFTEWPEFIYLKTVMPAPTVENEIINFRGRDYISKENSDNVLEWLEVGRLREYKVGEGENSFEINVQVPPQIKVVPDLYTHTMLYECPIINSIIIPTFSNNNFIRMSKFFITLYHGRKMFTGAAIPYSSADALSLDLTIDTGISLKPSYLYDNFHAEFLNWQTYRARAFTKYIELSLPQLVSLQWGKRYVINGVIVVLSTINYDIPYDGKVKIEGFTG